EIVEPSSPSMLCASSDRLDLCYQKNISIPIDTTNVPIPVD
ncbi:hypothetical protein Tco_1489122, partial [Tanacetum coccineum]